MGDLPISTSELAVLGEIDAACAEAMAGLGPSPSELAHARGWLDCAPAPVIDALSNTGEFESSGHAERMLDGHCLEMADWASQVWSEEPAAIVAPDVMIGTLITSMRASDDDDHEAADWLWSPVGMPCRGNSARLTGPRRHMAHLIRVSETGGLNLDPQQTLQAALEHTRQLAQRSSAALEQLGDVRLRALENQNGLWAVAAAQQTPEAAHAAAEASRAVFTATAESWQHLLLASCADTEEPIDAFGWASMSVRRLTDWCTWINLVISDVCDGPEEREPFERLSWWAAADLLMRSRAYPATFVDDDGPDPAVLLAHDLLGRGYVHQPQRG